MLRAVGAGGRERGIAQRESAQRLTGMRGIFDGDFPRTAREEFAADFDEAIRDALGCEQRGKPVGGVALQNRAEVELQPRIAFSERRGIDGDFLPAGLRTETRDGRIVGRCGRCAAGAPLSLIMIAVE